MIFDNVIEQIQAEDKNTEVVIVKLGEVSSVTPGGRAYVKLYGDGAPSTKLYTYIDGYFPEVGDKVALLPQGKTYIILGKVNEKDPVELYAKIKWVEENFCPIEYKSIIEDASNPAENITFGNYALLPTTDNRDTLGASDKNFKEIFIKKLTLDGESFTKIYQDRIFVVNANNTYSLIATYAAGAVTLTPSADNMWKLGTSAAQLAEVWTKLFRGAWKSGNQTERQLSWNSANAIVPDASESVDLGTASLLFNSLFIKTIMGGKWKYNSNAANDISWGSATEIIPNTNQTVSLGSSTKQFNAVYLKEIYISGTKFDPGEITLDELTSKAGNVTRTLKLTASAAGATILPSNNNVFELGSSSYKFKEIVSTLFTGDLDGKIKDGTYNLGFDSNHNFYPSATNALNLGTSSNQFNKVYAKEFYINGTKLDPSATTVNALTDTTGEYSRSLTLTASSSGATILPGDNNAYELGGSSAKFSKVYATEFNGDLLGDLKDGTYRLGFDSNHNFYPNTNNAISLGASSYQFNKTYTKELYLNGTKFDPDDLVLSKLTASYGTSERTLTMTASSSNTTLTPSSNETFELGVSNTRFLSIQSQKWSYGSNYLRWDGSSNVYPHANNTVSLGRSDRQFKNIYGQNVYVNGTAVSSDRRKKDDIAPLDYRYKEFFKSLNPVSFKYKDGTSGRKHTGFIAQEVEEAAAKAELTDKDIAVVVKDTEGGYYLRYEEIIAVQTEVIQELMAKVDTLETRLARLEGLLANK